MNALLKRPGKLLQRPERDYDFYRELSVPCSCHLAGSFCHSHGTYQPATDDHEVTAEVLIASRVRNVATRVIRKPLEK